MTTLDVSRTGVCDLRCRLIAALLFIANVVVGQNARQQHHEIIGNYVTDAWIYTPPAYSNSDPTGFPILLSLHGGSGIVDNNNFNVIVDNSLPADRNHLTPGRLIFQNAWKTSLPFIVVSPQLKRDFSVAFVNEQTWPTDLLDEVVEYVKNNFNVDESRIYVTGISVGATGTWDYAVAYPGKVAAIVPMGGKGAKSYACNLKDVPVWAFHGQDDSLVPNRFSSDMVEAIIDCSPAGKYKPRLNLNNSMAHEIWNPLFTGSGGFDIYSWLLAFRKGDDANKAPFVFTGNDRMVKVRPGPIYLYGEYFDSDGTIQTVQWTQIGGSPSLTLQDTNTPFLKIVNPQAGVFTFRLTVTDDDGQPSSSDVQLDLRTTSVQPEVTGMILYRQNPSTTSPVWDGLTEIGPISDDLLIDSTTITSGRINILAQTTGTVNRIKWSINGDQHTRDNGSPFHIKLITNRLNTTGWGVFKGTYLICATPYTTSTMTGEGTSICYKVTVTDEVGVQKYYSRPGVALDLSNVNKWSSNPDGSGSQPANFSTANQWFIVSGTETLSGSLSVTGTRSRFVLSPGAQLTVTGNLTGLNNIYLEGNASLTVSGTGNVTGFRSVGRSSKVTYNGSVNIPGGNVVFGNLNITGTGQRILAGGITNVRGNLFIQPDVRRGSDNSAFNVSGNVTILTPSTLPYQLRFSEGYGDQNLTLPGNHTFFNVFVDGGCTANVVAPPNTTITLGTVAPDPAKGGRLDVASFALLKLNGHNLSFVNRPVLNLTSFNSSNGTYTIRTGKIELTNSTISVRGLAANPLPDTSFNLYPAKGKNSLNVLNVHLNAAYPGIKIWEPLKVTEGIKLADGKILSRGNLTLVSTSTSTAYVAPVIAPATIIGNVNVERMLMGGKDYRYLSFPVENFTVADLQEYFPVTGEFTGSSPGFSKAASLYVYENLPSPGWVPFPSAGQNASTPFEIGKGYAVYVRNTPNPKRLTFTGPLHVGPVVYPLADNPGASTSRGWNLIGNPYAAPIFWEGNAPITGWTATSVDPSVHVRDNQQDDFKIWDGEAGDEEFSGMIATGQSFWVRSVDNNAALTINEEAKQELTSPLLFRAERSGATVLSIALRRGERKNTCFIKFNSKGQPAWIRGFDSMKRKGDHANISILSSDNFEFAIKSLSDTVCSQEARLQVETDGPGMYSILCKGTAFDRLINKLYIVDHFTQVKTEILEDKDFTFEVSTDPASAVPNRFTLIIEKSNIDQPVITLDDGYLVSSVESGLQWMLNGVDIEGATGQVLLPAEDGDYSVRTLGKNCMKTSETFAFRITGAEDEHADVKIYPNPASDHLKVSGLAPGEQGEFEIISVTGASIRHSGFRAGESGEVEINLGSTSPGFYVLRIQGRGRSEFKFSVR